MSNQTAQNQGKADQGGWVDGRREPIHPDDIGVDGEYLGSDKLPASDEDVPGSQAPGAGDRVPAQKPGFAAGSEGWDGTEDATAPVVSANQAAADSTSNPDAAVNTASQAIPMRHLGDMPQDTISEAHGGSQTSDAAGAPVQRSEGEKKGDASPGAPMNSMVPPST